MQNRSDVQTRGGPRSGSAGPAGRSAARPTGASRLGAAVAGAALTLASAAAGPTAGQSQARPDAPADTPRPVDGRDLETPPDTLGLKAFLVRTLDRSPGAEAATRRRNADRHGARSGLAAPNPTLEAEGPDADGVAELRVRQPLRLFDQTDAARNVARAERRLADRRLTRDHASLARRAARSYLEAAAVRRELAVAEELLELRRDALERAEAALRREAAGRARVHEARMELRAVRREVYALRRTLSRRLEGLRRLGVLGPEHRLRLVDALAGDPDRRAGPPVPEQLPDDAPELAEARAGVRLAEARLGRERAVPRPVPSVGPMLSVGEGLDPGVSLELDLPLWDRNRPEVRAARARVAASEAAARAARRSARAEYRRLLARRSDIRRSLERLRSDELAPARRELRRRAASRELGMPVAAARREARTRLLELRRVEVGLQRRLSLLAVDAAWRSGTLLEWLREPAPVPASEDGARELGGLPSSRGGTP